MRLPRDLSGRQLAKSLEALGYEVTRQAGSHLRLTTQLNGEHHVTVPEHDPLKIGTLGAVLRDVSEHHRIERSELLRTLFE